MKKALFWVPFLAAVLAIWLAVERERKEAARELGQVLFYREWNELEERHLRVRWLSESNAAFARTNRPDPRRQEALRALGFE